MNMENKDTIVLTRRIQLLINLDDKELISEAYKTLYQWQYTCFRAANYICTHLFLQEQVKDLFYFTDETRVKLADIKKDENGILTTSRMNTTYQLLSKNFKGEVPMTILGCLNVMLFTNFNNERAAYRKGERSLRNYKRDIPIPFGGSADLRKWQFTEDEKNFTFNLFGIPFRTYLGKDFTDKKVLLNKTLAGMVKLCASSIQLKGNKIYLLAAFRIQKEKHDLDEAIVAEAALSIDFPLIVTVGKNRYNIGSKEEFLYRRLAIQSARRRLQKAVRYNNGGKGRHKKLLALDRFSETEKNYVNSRMHLYSRMLIDICVKHGAATLILTDQQDKEEMAKEDEFLLRNWSYHLLKEKIAYKAEKAGITMIVE
jgi:IS605 OrfB family transposase